MWKKIKFAANWVWNMLKKCFCREVEIPCHNDPLGIKDNDSSFRSSLERMKIGDDKGLCSGKVHCESDKLSKKIRRTWNDYCAKYTTHRVIFFSGHEGPHSQLYGTTQGNEYYMVDGCWVEVQPDAVLDLSNPLDRRYLGGADIDELVIDDPRFLADKHAPDLMSVEASLPMLRQGGKLIFKPGFGSGWPRSELSTDGIKELVVSDSGRMASIDVKKLPLNEQDRAKLIQQANNNASSFYKKMGFSEAVYDEKQSVFILTK